MNAKRLIPALWLLAVATGCQTTRPTLEQLAKIDSIHVLPVVEKDVNYSGKLPSEYEVDQGNGWLANPYTAPIGLVIELFSYSDTRKKRSDRLRQIFADAQLDLPGTLHATFSGRLAENGIFPVLATSPSAGGAVIELEASYGVRGSRFLDSEWSPWLTVVGRLRDATGEVIWQCSSDAEAGVGRVRQLPFPDPFDDASLLRAQFHAATEVVSQALIRHLTHQD